MFVRRLVMLTLVAVLALSSAPAHASSIAADGCDETLFTEMTQRAQASFDNMDSLVISINKPPNSIQNFQCARNNFSMWDTGWKGLSGIISGIISAIVSWIMSLFGLRMLLPGLTLTESSPFAIVISWFKSFFQNATNTSEYVCPEIWTDTIGHAMRQVSFGTSSYNPTLGIVQFGSASFDPNNIAKFALTSCLGGMNITFPTGMDFNGLVSALQSQFINSVTAYISSLIGMSCFF